MLTAPLTAGHVDPRATLRVRYAQAVALDGDHRPAVRLRPAPVAVVEPNVSIGRATQFRGGRAFTHRHVGTSSPTWGLWTVYYRPMRRTRRRIALQFRPERGRTDPVSSGQPNPLQKPSYRRRACPVPRYGAGIQSGWARVDMVPPSGSLGRLLVLSQLEYDELADVDLSPLPSWERARACPVLDTGVRVNRSTKIMLTWYLSSKNTKQSALAT